MLGSIPESICFVGFDRRIQRVNPVACQLLGYEASQLRGALVDTIIQGASEVLPLSGALHARLLAKESVKRLQITFLGRHGEAIPAEASCSLVRDHNGQPKAVVVVARDLRSEHGLKDAKEAEAELRKDNAALESQLTQAQRQLILADRLAAVGTLTAGIAHEINSPLAYVLNNLEAITSEFTDCMDLVNRNLTHLPSAVRFDIQERAHAVDRFLTVAMHGVLRVCETVHNLRTFARDDGDMTRTAVDLHHALDTAADITFPEVKYRALLVKDYGEPARVNAAEGRLCQVFINLLINAAQSIPAGAAEHNTIRVATRLNHSSNGSRVVIEVHDTGVGISDEVRDRIFDPFFTTKPPGEGSGLGLSICYGIVRSLGGEIRVNSQPGRGSTFTVELPVAAAPVKNHPSRSDNPSAA
jgi:PAS domain S-box-containing protein